MKGRKIIYLFLALILPLLLSTFFKYCTTPQFDVPILFQEGSLQRSGCVPLEVKPYAIPDTILTAAGWDSRKKLSFIFLSMDHPEMERRLKWLEEFRPQVNILELNPVAGNHNACYFFMTPDSSSMLVDSQRRVRSYYGRSQRDTDRLEAELKILLEK